MEYVWLSEKHKMYIIGKDNIEETIGGDIEDSYYPSELNEETLRDKVRLEIAVKKATNEIYRAIVIYINI